MFGLYTNKVNKPGAIASIIVGLITVIVWYYSGMSDYIYEAIPGIIISTIVLLVVSRLTGGADSEITEQYNGYIAKLRAARGSEE